MKVLWICNNVLPDFCEEFGLRWNFGAGWVTGMLHEFLKDPSCEIALCFPIIDEFRMKTSKHLNCSYYSFHMNMNDHAYDPSMKSEFVEIIKDFIPDVVHIWGTERNHARAAFEACMSLKMKERALVYIQGLAEMIAFHYSSGVPKEVVERKDDSGACEIKMEQEQFYRWAKTERFIFENADFVTGRTEWDKAYVKRINPSANYIECNEILRAPFYDSRAIWNVEHCVKHRIFLSQAHYPIKGFHFFIKALAYVVEKFPDTTVRVGGFHPMSPNQYGKISTYGEYLNDLMQKYGVEHRIEFLGTLKEADMVREYRDAHVYVLPSTIDNSSNSVAEAMMVGTPVVASYVGGIPSIVCHGRDGITYPCDEYYMLAHYVERVFEDDSLAKYLSEEAQKTASIRHNPVENCVRMKEIYQKIYRINLIS